MSLNKTIVDYGLLVLLAAVFASNFSATKIAVAGLEPAVVVTGRLAVAAVILLALLWAAGQKLPASGKVWWLLIGSAFFGHMLPFSLLAWSQQKLDAGLTAILMATMPLFTLLLAQLFTRDEKPTRYSVAGFALALVGIVILFGPDKLASLADQSLRQYAAMLAAMGYGVNAIITKWLFGLTWQQSTASFMVLAFLMSLPWLLLSEISAGDVGWEVWASVLYSGLMPTALGAVMIVIIIGRTGASFLSQINFLVPVFGVLFSIALLGERLPANGATALAIILAGVALARRRPKRDIISINRGV